MEDEYAMRKACLEAALKMNLVTADAVTEAAGEFLKFLRGSSLVYKSVPVPDATPQVIVPHNPKPLTSVQKYVQKALIEFYKKEGGPFSATEALKDMQWTKSGPAFHYNVSALEKEGYIRRVSRTQLVPVLDTEGSPIGPVVKTLPPAVAKGYSSMNFGSGAVGRFPS